MKESATVLVEQGAYPAVRASALAGVPKSTLHYWARTELIVPSVSPTRERLWSYADLMAIRTVDWLRQRKRLSDSEVAATPVRQIREMLRQLERERRELWAGTRDEWYTPIRVDASGRILLLDHAGARDLAGQRIALDALDPFAPFESGGMRGPHLVMPRPTLRIIPGRLSGEPHIRSTRISTSAIAALAARRFEVGAISEMYGGISIQSVLDAVDLERQLGSGIAQAA